MQCVAYHFLPAFTNVPLFFSRFGTLPKNGTLWGLAARLCYGLLVLTTYFILLTVREFPNKLRGVSPLVLAALDHRGVSLLRELVSDC